MTTNKNRTATAPTYTMRMIIAMNSTSSNKKRPVALKNTKIKKSTECTGFLDPMTIIPDNIARAEKK
jgi:hypothetical protein